MKVLFANPPWWSELVTHQLQDGSQREIWHGGVRAGSRWPFTQPVQSWPDKRVEGDYLPYPFFLGFAASYARAHSDAEIHFRDYLALRWSYERFFMHVIEERFDMLVMESASPSWAHDEIIIAALKKHLPALKIVIAGPIASNSAAVLQTGHVTAVIKGEYEKGSVRAINGETGVIDYDMLSRDEMNAAPIPWNDTEHAHLYWDPNPKSPVAPQAHVWSSRGCPFKCIFCVWPATMTGNDPDGSGKRSVRHYSKDYMIAWLTEWRDKFGYKSVYFDDDTFNLGSRHVENMCTAMEAVQLPWAAMCRADTSKMSLWQRMRESGCYGVKLGVESGNQFVVDHIVNKHLDLQTVRDAVTECKHLGMSVHGTFTYGLPGESREQMQDTKAFIASLPFDSVQESGTAEIEGTPLATLREEGSLDAYQGANIDSNYQIDTDGARKWHQLVTDLRDGT